MQQLPEKIAVGLAKITLWVAWLFRRLAVLLARNCKQVHELCHLTLANVTRVAITVNMLESCTCLLYNYNAKIRAIHSSWHICLLLIVPQISSVIKYLSIVLEE